MESRAPIQPRQFFTRLPLFHFVPLLAIFTGVTLFDWMVCIVLYFARVFFITGFHHRYFSHKAFKTSRPFQFVMAFLAQTAAQKGVLWWAGHHRVHHKYSDTKKDPHSMKQFGFLYSHFGWIIGDDYVESRYDLLPDLVKYKELIWLDRLHILPALTLAIAVTALGAYVNGGSVSLFFTHHGMSTLLIGFFLSTVLVYHATFSINSLMHRIGKKRYETGDESKNSLLLALFTFGEGWHNNHHYYPGSARQGFYWWEIDITYYLLKALSWVGLIWDLKPVPAYVRESRTKDELRKLKAESLESPSQTAAILGRSASQ